MNDQRKVVYEQRKELLTIKDINQIFIDMLYDTLTNIIEKNKSNQEEELNFKNIFTDIKNIFGLQINNKIVENSDDFLII